MRRICRQVGADFASLHIPVLAVFLSLCVCVCVSDGQAQCLRPFSPHTQKPHPSLDARPLYKHVNILNLHYTHRCQHAARKAGSNYELIKRLAEEGKDDQGKSAGTHSQKYPL